MYNIEVLPASGITYSDVSDIVEKIASDKAKQYHRIAYYDADDIAQEVRIKCFMTLKNYDPERSSSSVHSFLAVCADNRLKDIRRNTVYKHNSPCTRCPFWFSKAAASGIHDCMKYGNKNECVKFAKHDRYVMSKLSINSPSAVEDEMALDKRTESEVLSYDFSEAIISQLPSGCLRIFAELQHNNYSLRALPKEDRADIVSAIRKIFSREDF